MIIETVAELRPVSLFLLNEYNLSAELSLWLTGMSCFEIQYITISQSQRYSEKAIEKGFEGSL